MLVLLVEMCQLFLLYLAPRHLINYLVFLVLIILLLATNSINCNSNGAKLVLELHCYN